TVVLPQGRFSTFLRAKPDERAQVLRDVFGTEIYQRFQDELTELARQARRDVAAARQEGATAVSTFAALLPEDDPTAAALTAAARAGRRQAEAAERAAQEGLDAERDLEQRVARRRALLAARAALAEREPAVAALREQLAAARRAAVAAGALRAHEQARAAQAD